MFIMAAHEMMTLGASVSGSVDLTYTNDDLCDGDPAYPIKLTGGSLSLAITGTSMAIDGLVVANHNLPTACVVDFSGLGAVDCPTVPPGGIRLNGVELLNSPVTTGSTTVTITSSPEPDPIIIGEVFAGKFRQIRYLPPRTDF